MSSRSRQTSRKRVDTNDSVWNPKTIAILTCVIVCFYVLLLGISRVKQSQVSAVPNEFEGRIVDKSLGSNETEQGSYPYYRLTVELEGQLRLTVPVTRTVYQEAQVGARLRRSAKGLEVIPVSTGNVPGP